MTNIFVTIFSTVGASHFLVTYLEHLDYISIAYMFRVLYQHHKISCRESEKFDGNIEVRLRNVYETYLSTSHVKSILMFDMQVIKSTFGLVI